MMYHSRLTATLGLFLTVCFFCVVTPSGGWAEEKQKQTIEQAFRAFSKGISSNDKEERLKAIKAFVADKKDVEVLFPKHVEIVWKHFGEHRKQAIEMCDEIAKSETRLGEIKEVFPMDMRGKDGRDSYKRVLAMIPKDVPVFVVGIKYEKGGAQSSAIVFVNDKWVVMWGLQTMPDFIEKNK